MSKLAKVPEIMKAAQKTFEDRGAVYGDSPDRHGNVMQALFPQGINLSNPEEFSRFSLFNYEIGKLVRYANNFAEGGHQDSAHDAGVYAFMLEAYTKPEFVPMVPTLKIGDTVSFGGRKVKILTEGTSRDGRAFYKIVDSGTSKATKKKTR